MASKRKAPGLDAPSSKAEGKRRADAEVEPEEDDLLEAALLLGDGDADGGDDADDLAAAVEGAADGFGEEYAFGTGEDESDAGDVSECDFDDIADSVPIDEASLTSSADVSLKGVGLSLPEARRVAQLLARNSSLSCIHFEGHDMQISDLNEDDELEWDSEEYTDLEAIVIAELLKPNTTVKRLDLARNQIGDAGARALASMLEVNTSIEYLNLESNVFGEKAGQALASALVSNVTLQYLNLSYNSVPSSTQDEIRSVWQQGVGRGKTGLHL